MNLKLLKASKWFVISIVFSIMASAIMYLSLKPAPICPACPEKNCPSSSSCSCSRGDEEIDPTMSVYVNHDLDFKFYYPSTYKINESLKQARIIDEYFGFDVFEYFNRETTVPLVSVFDPEYEGDSVIAFKIKKESIDTVETRIQDAISDFKKQVIDECSDSDDPGLCFGLSGGEFIQRRSIFGLEALEFYRGGEGVGLSYFIFPSSEIAIFCSGFCPIKHSFDDEFEKSYFTFFNNK